ncbi:MAG: type II secretion system protein [Planctomycetaceae bacterium]|nr:type II secretion system protein [Planctomycetaceae bacterium]
MIRSDSQARHSRADGNSMHRARRKDSRICGKDGWSGERVHRQAMTLVELLAALTLAGILFASAGALMQAIRRTEHRVQQLSDQEQPWLQALDQLLQRDLQNSDQMQIRPNELLLTGHCAVLNGQATTQRATVRWHLEKIDDLTWLVRSQQLEDSATNAGETTERILAGISHFQIDVPGDEVAENAGVSDWQNVPTAVELSLQGVDLSVPSRRTVNRVRRIMARAGFLR